ncbi:MAG TPA: hypothetical protein VKM55_06285 [Candidatus Lokiarchaeia archaeon]|nr:hypothetical protein [Candidatus Lokiarchaeia archaeon]
MIRKPEGKSIQECKYCKKSFQAINAEKHHLYNRCKKKFGREYALMIIIASTFAMVLTMLLVGTLGILISLGVMIFFLAVVPLLVHEEDKAEDWSSSVSMF